MAGMEGTSGAVVMAGDGSNGDAMGAGAGAGANGEMPRVDAHGVSGSTQDYSQWVAQMQAYYKQPPVPQPGGQPYYGAQMTPHAHAYANLWNGQAPMMSPYGAPASFYPYPHPGIPPHQVAYGGYAPPQAAAPAAGEYAREIEQKETEQKGVDSAEYWRQRQTAGPPAVPQGMDYNAAVIQDEREAKRQRRKQSNRESARRSRLRKQAECEDLGSRVSGLTQENLKLRLEVVELGKKVDTRLQQNKTMRTQITDSGGSALPEPHLPESALDAEFMKNAPEYPAFIPAVDSGSDSDSEDDKK